MKRREMRSVCRDVEHGHRRVVEHHISHEHGEVISCDREQFEVKTAGKYHHWAADNCDSE